MPKATSYMKKEKLNTTAINHMQLTISIRLLFTLYGLGIATLPAFADISEYTLSDLSAQKKCIANYSLPDGSKFLGLIENGKKNGKGEELFTNGDRYVGNYVDDAPTGVGIHLMSNGGRYLGQLKDGNYHGKGVLITPDGKIEKEGVWSDDKFVKSQPIGIDPRFDYVKNYDTLVSLLSEDAPTATNLPLPPCVGPTQNWKRCWVKVEP